MVYGLIRWGRFIPLVRTWSSAMGMWSMGSTSNGSGLRRQPEDVGTMIISLTRKPGERPSPEGSSVVKQENKPMARNHYEINKSREQTCTRCDSARRFVCEQRASSGSRFENEQP